MAITVSAYNNFISDIGLGRINLGTHTFKAVLVNGYTFDATHTSYAQVSGELPNGNGYTTGGKALTNVTWGYDAGHTNTKFDADDVVWSAAGGSIGPATGFVIYDDTVTTPENDRLCLYVDFGSSQTAGDSTDFKMVMNALGIFTIGA